MSSTTGVTIRPLNRELPPVVDLPSDLEAWRTRVVTSSSLALGLLAIGYLPSLYHAEGSFGPVTATAAIAGVLWLGLALAARRISVRLHGMITLGLLTLALAFAAWFTGGIASNALWWNALVPLAATFMVGGRFGLVTAVLVVLETSAFLLATQAGVTFPEYGEPGPMNWTHVVSVSGLVVFVAALAALFDLQRSRAEMAIRRSRNDFRDAAARAESAETRLRNLLRSASSPIMLLDADGVLEFQNEEAASLFGTRIGEHIPVDGAGAMVARFVSQVKSIHSSIHQPVTIPMQAPDSAGRGGIGPRELLVAVSPFKDSLGTLQGVIVTATDDTERRRQERRLRSARIQAEEQERQRIALELHDELGQGLTGLRLLIDVAQRKQSSGHLEDARRQVDEIIGRVRDLSLDLRPAVLDDLGLAPALLRLLERIEQRADIDVELRHRGLEKRLPADVETAAYRVVQEGLTNVIRHAGATHARVRVWVDDERVFINVEDDGKGFDPANQSSGAGVAGMRDRVTLLGGTFEVQSSPGNGTRVHIEVPCSPASDVSSDVQ